MARSGRQSKSRSKRRSRQGPWAFWPGARTRRRWRKRFAAAPRAAQFLLGATVVVALWGVLNWTYQVVRKPAELFFPVSGALSKAPAETWRRYEGIFRAHATAVITPELLAALAQVEGAGNPVARTYWRWYATWDPFEVYRPASSAVGMYQITDGTFAVARRYCIHDHTVVEDGPWHELRSCWFNGLYARVVPSHAAELTSAYLDRGVTRILERYRAAASRQQQQDLAAVIHLCGAGAGDAYVRRGFRFTGGQRCGDHDAAAYLARVNLIRWQFQRMAALNTRK